MKLKKRKIKYSAIFFICWFALLVILVDGFLKFQTLVDNFGSYALVEITQYVHYLSAVKESIAIEKRYSVESPHIDATRDKNVTRYSLGIRCIINNKKDCTSFIIEKGTEIPCEQKKFIGLWKITKRH